MGLFSFLNKRKKQPGPKVKDIIWMHGDGKKQGCLKLLQHHPQAALIAWFPETQQQWQVFLQQKQMPQTVLLVRSMNALQLAGKTIIMLEHYPLAAKEDAFFVSLAQQEILVLSAMDDPLFTKFGGERIIDLMQKMGMKENEAIEHKMITKSLRNAQTKLEQRTTIEHSSTSMQEWFAKNSG